MKKISRFESKHMVVWVLDFDSLKAITYSSLNSEYRRRAWDVLKTWRTFQCLTLAIESVASADVEWLMPGTPWNNIDLLELETSLDRCRLDEKILFLAASNDSKVFEVLAQGNLQWFVVFQRTWKLRWLKLRNGVKVLWILLHIFTFDSIVDEFGWMKC